jgi:4-hydroxythreonine-4-phosphate dehydrogenase
MNSKPILIVAGEPNSVFLEIFFKSLKSKKFKKPILLIASKKIVILQMKKLNYKFKINSVLEKDIGLNKLNNDYINIIDIAYNSKKPFEKISKKSNKYIKKSFELALKLLKSGISDRLINGPISKKYFLRKKYLGVTEYLADKTSTKNFAMLIYNKNLSVSPLTTHLPLKFVSKNLDKDLIIKKVQLINDFYKDKFNIAPKIAITGLNPHCENKFNAFEDEKIVLPSVKFLKKKKLKIFGPYAADTIFLKDNRKKFDIIIGMYHDQVLGPVKTLYEFNAINITLGLPFIRISPDHGPNEKMMGKNLSNPLSLIKAITFLEKN